MTDTIETIRDEAMRAVLRVLRAPDAKPDTLLRAAETLLRVTPEAQGATRGAIGLADAELLALARGGEGVHPPKRGPAESRAGAVPSASSEVAAQDPEARMGERKAESEARKAESEARSAQGRVGSAPPLPGLVTPKSLGGTQKGPTETPPPGGASPSFAEIARRGPKKDPPIATPTPQVASQIKIDDTPTPRANGDSPEPWE